MICYTTILGNYDTLVDPPFTSIPLVCFTDRLEISSSVWKIIRIKSSWNSVDQRIRLSRKYKLLAHKLFPNEDQWIWIDANLKFNTDPARIADYLTSHDLATFRYPNTWGKRECLYIEAKACIEKKKDDADVIASQIERYRNSGYPQNNGLAETSILIRRNTEECRRFNQLWWQELSKGSRRDQISFPYVSWLLNFKYDLLPGCRVNNAFSVWEPHKENAYK